jgi:hypothetical protein
MRNSKEAHFLKLQSVKKCGHVVVENIRSDNSYPGKIVVVQCSPPDPQTSNIGPMVGDISGVVVTILLVEIVIIFIKQDSSSTIFFNRYPD